jgi:predicted  nucleic acid-binding Zn-ribbon protein
MLKAILNYQEIDRKLYQLERELAGSAERKKYVKLKKYMEAASEKLDGLDAKAESLKHEAETLAEKYAVTEAALAEFEHMEELVENGGADLAFYKKKVTMHLDRMKKLKADIAALEETIKATDKEFKELKAEVIAKQAEYKTAKEEYNVLKESKEGEKSAIDAELAKASAGIDEAVMARYKSKRKEKLFPVYSQLFSGRCSCCSMEPPIAAQSKLSGGATIECDNCHRILYID